MLLELYRRHRGLVATLIMIDTYAMSNLEAPEQVNDAIRAFCRAHPASSG